MNSNTRSGTGVDSKLVMDELAAGRNKMVASLSDDLAMARAFASQETARCAALEAENAELRERLSRRKTPKAPAD